MSLVYNMIKMTIHRMQNDFLTSLFLIFGLTLSILLVSAGTSFAAEHLYAEKVKEDGKPPNGEAILLHKSTEREFVLDEFNRIFQGIREDSGIIVNGLSLHTDGSKINTYSSVSAEWFSKDNGWHYPLAEGRYFTAEEIYRQEKVILIGKEKEQYTWEEEGKKYISVSGERYEVLGIVGIRGQATLWDSRIFMPCTALPETTGKELKSEEDIYCIIYNGQGEVQKDIERIRKNGMELFDKFSVENLGNIETEDMAADLMASQDMIFLVAILGYLVTLFFAVNIVVLWIEKRRYEMVVRKAFGYTNGAIIRMIFLEMMGIALLSATLAIIIQGCAGTVIERIAGYTLQLYLPNVFVGLFVVLLTAGLTSVLPAVRILNIQPAAGLQER